LALTNGHGRYMTVTPERTLFPVNFCPFHFRIRRVTAVSLLKPPFGGFRSETTTWIQKWFKKIRWNF
jgi:hypothetical protein